MTKTEQTKSLATITDLASRIGDRVTEVLSCFYLVALSDSKGAASQIGSPFLTSGVNGGSVSCFVDILCLTSYKKKSDCRLPFYGQASQNITLKGNKNIQILKRLITQVQLPQRDTVEENGCNGQ